MGFGRKVCCVHNKSLKCNAFFGVIQKCYSVVFIHEPYGAVSEVEVYFCPLVPKEQRLKMREVVECMVAGVE